MRPRTESCHLRGGVQPGHFATKLQRNCWTAFKQTQDKPAPICEAPLAMGSNDLPPPSAPVSMLLRQDVKKKSVRLGVAALVVGLFLIALAVFAFTRSGAEVLGVVAAVFGVSFVGVGGHQLRKASQNS